MITGRKFRLTVAERKFRGLGKFSFDKNLFFDHKMLKMQAVRVGGGA